MSGGGGNAAPSPQEDELRQGGWFPVSRSEEVVKRHIVHTMLDGQELAVWRDDLGFVNAWENRCPHRGVRFSIGLNLGNALQCQYHGWRFASQTGQCQLIPAHPKQKPSNAIKASKFGCVEHLGFVWVNLNPNLLPLPAIDIRNAITLRSTYIATGIRLIARYFKDTIALIPFRHQTSVFRRPDPNGSLGGGDLFLFLQPFDAEQTMVHGIVNAETRDEERLVLLRRYNSWLRELRDDIETASPRLL